MSHLDYFYRLFPVHITAGFCYSYTQVRWFITKLKFNIPLGIKTAMLCCIVKLPDEVCVSHTKRVGENKTVLQLKQFAEVLLTGLTFNFFFFQNKKLCFHHEILAVYK